MCYNISINQLLIYVMNITVTLSDRTSKMAGEIIEATSFTEVAEKLLDWALLAPEHGNDHIQCDYDIDFEDISYYGDHSTTFGGSYNLRHPSFAKPDLRGHLLKFVDFYCDACPDHLTEAQHQAVMANVGGLMREGMIHLKELILFESPHYGHRHSM